GPQVFSSHLIERAGERDDVVAIAAAMAGPTGLAEFGEVFPQRTFDVGIAEQHAVTSAAGLALGGLHPVVAVYSTFLNRAFAQMLMDVGLLGLGVTFVLDRAGITGPDGASHHGMRHMSMTAIVPGTHGVAPRAGAQRRLTLDRCQNIAAAASAVRCPKATSPAETPAVRQQSSYDVLFAPRADDGAGAKKRLVINYGALVGQPRAAAEA